MVDRFLQDHLHLVVDGAQRILIQFADFRSGMDACLEQYLVGIDVADAATMLWSMRRVLIMPRRPESRSMKASKSKSSLNTSGPSSFS